MSDLEVGCGTTAMPNDDPPTTNARWSQDDGSQLIEVVRTEFGTIDSASEEFRPKPNPGRDENNEEESASTDARLIEVLRADLDSSDALSEESGVEEDGERDEEYDDEEQSDSTGDVDENEEQEQEFNSAEVLRSRDDADEYQDLVDDLPDGHPGRPWALNLLATALHERFTRTRDVACLETAIEWLKEALELCKPEVPDLPAYMSNLCSIFLVHYQHSKNSCYLEEWVKHGEDAVRLCPSGYPSRALALYSLANALHIQSAISEDDGDMARVVELYTETAQSASSGDEISANCFHNLAAISRQRSRLSRSHRRRYLEECVRYHEQALECRQEGHPDRADSLSGLADGLIDLFELTSQRHCIDRAIDLSREASRLCPGGHPDHVSSLMQLGLALNLRHGRCSDSNDVHDIPEVYRDALKCFAKADPLYAEILALLQRSIILRAEKSGSSFDIEEGVILSEQLVELDTADRAASLAARGRALLVRHEFSQGSDDLEGAIAAYREALRLRPEGHEDHINIELSTALLARWLRSREREGLQQSVALCEGALARYSERDEKRASFLYSYASVLSARHGAKSDIQDLNVAIEAFKDALQIFPETHPKYLAGSLLLARALLVRFKFDPLEDSQDLFESLNRTEVGLRMLPKDHKLHGEYALEHAHGLLNHYTQFKSKESLSAAIEELQNGLEQTSRWLTGRVCGHNNPAIQIPPAILMIHISNRVYAALYLARALLSRFGHSGRVRDLNRSIKLLRWVLKCRPVNHQLGRGSALLDYGTSLLYRIQHSGSQDDLELCIKILREALDSLVHPQERILARSHLSIALRYRFLHLGDIKDLDRAIQMGSDALELCLETGSHSRHLALQNLSCVYITRFEVTQMESDLKTGLDLAMQVTHRRVSEILEEDADHAMALNTLSTIVIHNFMAKSRHYYDFFGGVQLGIQALTMLPADHAMRPTFFHDLAHAYAAGAQQFKDNRFWEQAVRIAEEAIAAVPQGHSRRSLFLQSLAWFQLEFFNQSGSRAQLMSAIRSLTAALGDSNRSPTSRLETAIAWLLETQTMSITYQEDERTTLLDAFWSAVRLLPRVAYLGLNIYARLKALKKSEQLARNGAIHALVLSKSEDAVEMLEEGRAVFWSQALSLRTTDDELPTNIGELRRVSSQLEVESFLDYKSTSHTPAMDRNAEIEAARRRRLSMRFEKLIEKARQEPGLERFLLNEKYADLARVAEKGHVVLLVPGHSLGYAVIIRPTGAQTVVLRSATASGLKYLSGTMKSVNMRLPDDDSIDGFQDHEVERAGGHAKASGRLLLKKLWLEICKPVIQALGIQRADDQRLNNRPRIWWCPAGPFSFLPLHAAGIYDSPTAECCSDYAVSSYTPTLGALLKARKDMRTIMRTQARMLLAVEPGPPGSRSYLSTAEAEAKAVANVVGSNVLLPIKPHNGDASQGHVWHNPTVQQVLQQLPHATILHLACHGKQNMEDPLESGFILHDGMKLTVSELMKLNLPKAFFSYMSACETAKGDREQPDQTIHLAATMLFAGFKTVVGTMWSMWDNDGPFVARTIYEQLYSKERIHFDPETIPYALDAAVRELRARKVAPERWATYIHMGI